MKEGLGVVPRDPHHRDPWGKSVILIPHSLGKISKIPWGKMGKIRSFFGLFKCLFSTFSIRKRYFQSPMTIFLPKLSKLYYFCLKGDLLFGFSIFT